MAELPTALFWRRLDTAGCEQALCTFRSGLRVRGAMLAATPVPYAGRYELYTDETWTTARCEVTVEGAGFARSVRLERAAGRWRVTATEQGNLGAALHAAGRPPTDQPGCEEPESLDAALDVDLSYSPLTNTLPIRRLRMLDGDAGASHTIHVAWILLPSLEVVDSSQTYEVIGDRRIRFVSGTFSTELDVDEHGYVRHYPELADLV
jgi:uncharacterized protein